MTVSGNELMRMASGELRPTRVERKLVKRARSVYDDTKIAGFKLDATNALAVKVMHGAKELDEIRRQLGQDDPSLNMLLCEIELTALAKAKSIQRGLFGNFGL